ncbi:uncharacterized [Tachysurus ichikawai]
MKTPLEMCNYAGFQTGEIKRYRALRQPLARFSSPGNANLHGALPEDRPVLLNAFLSYAFKPHADWLAVELTGTPLLSRVLVCLGM